VTVSIDAVQLVNCVDPAIVRDPDPHNNLLGPHMHWTLAIIALKIISSIQAAIFFSNCGIHYSLLVTSQ